MLSEYSSALKTAGVKETRVRAKYDRKKQELVSKQKELLKKELEKPDDVDYDPMECFTQYSELVEQFKQLQVDLQNDLQMIKFDLDTVLRSLMDSSTPKNPSRLSPCPSLSEDMDRIFSEDKYPALIGPLEVCKTIGKSEDSSVFACRVWFTTVQIEKWECVPGDPIRIEWYVTDTGQVTSTAERYGPGLDGLPYPYMKSPREVYNDNSFLTSEDDSYSMVYWEIWLRDNRPDL